MSEQEETLEPSGSSLWQYVAVVDERTCEQCLSNDGMIYSWEEVQQLFPNISPAGPDAYNVNMHPNCRCQLVKVAEGTEEEGEKPAGFLFWQEGEEAPEAEGERFAMPPEVAYLGRAATRAAAGARPYYIMRRTALAGLRRVYTAAGLPFSAALFASIITFSIAELIASYLAEEERRRREEEYLRERQTILADVQKLFNELKADLNRDKEEERRKALKDVRELSRTLISVT
ncbi:MAG: phage minor head protein [Candidatus Bathyarchaeia archaeon]